MAAMTDIIQKSKIKNVIVTKFLFTSSGKDLAIERIRGRVGCQPPPPSYLKGGRLFEVGRLME